MDEITMTQEELDKKIEEAVNKAKAEQEAELKKTHDSEKAQMRIKAKEELDKAVKKATEEANLSAEEKAKKDLEEKERQKEEEHKAEHEELEKLRLEKKINDRANKLEEAGLPKIFKNDTRLISANDDEVDDVIKTLKAEFEEIAPKVAVTDTNVRGASGNKITPEQAELERVRHLGINGKF